MFLVSMGIPLSWEKLQLGEDLSWIGWSLRLSVRSACLPRDKQSKILGLLCPLLKAGTRMPRREVERVIGLLLGFTAAAFWHDLCGVLQLLLRFDAYLRQLFLRRASLS